MPQTYIIAGAIFTVFLLSVGAAVLRKKRKVGDKKKQNKKQNVDYDEETTKYDAAKYKNVTHRNVGVKQKEDEGMGLRFSKKQNAEKLNNNSKEESYVVVASIQPSKKKQNDGKNERNDEKKGMTTDKNNIKETEKEVDVNEILPGKVGDVNITSKPLLNDKPISVSIHIEDYSDNKTSRDQSSETESRKIDVFSKDLSADVITTALSQVHELLTNNSTSSHCVNNNEPSLFVLDKHVEQIVNETFKLSYNDIRCYTKDKRACNGHSNYLKKDSLIEVANKNINSKNGLRNHINVTENFLCKENVCSNSSERNLIGDSTRNFINQKTGEAGEKEILEPLYNYANSLAEELLDDSNMSLKNLSLRRFSLKSKPKLNKNEIENKVEEKDSVKQTNNNNKENRKFFKKKKDGEQKSKETLVNGYAKHNDVTKPQNGDKSSCISVSHFDEQKQTELDGVKPETRNALSPDQLNVNKRPISDRPLSGFAEKLAELLADEDDDLAFFDSEEELNKSLSKMRENFSSKRAISVEIDKMQRRYSVDELNDYGCKKLKSHIKNKKANRKKNYRRRGDRPKSLYDQDILNDFLSNMNEQTVNGGDDNNETSGSEEEDEEEEEEIQPVQATIELFENEIPLLPDEKFRSNTTSEYDRVFDETLKMQRSVSVTSSSSRKGSAYLKKAAVIDAGSGALKAGLCGESKPRCYCPSVIGTPRRFSQDVSKMKKGFYVGDEAWSYAGMLQIEHPIRQNITNWSDVSNIFEYILEQELNINNSEHPVLLTEMSLTSRRNREKITEIMFESFGIPSYYLANQGVLALYSMGLVTGLSLNSGYYTTQATPVYEGNALPYATTQLDIGGDHVTDYLGRMLQGNSGFSFSSSSEKLVLNSMKQAVCYIPQDVKREEALFKEKSDMRASYNLPDGQVIEVGSERCIAPEILFDPDMLGLQQPNTAELISESLNRVNPDLSDILSTNILVSGGNTKLKGFSSRLDKELSYIYKNSRENISLQYAEDRIFSTWIGGSVLASIPVFREQWINIESYAEQGSQIIHKYCF